MRVLLTTRGSSGHIHPMIPVARALVDAGHEVAFAAAGSSCPQIEALGFPTFACGFDRRGVGYGPLFPEAAGLDGDALAAFIEVKMFAGHTARSMALDLLPICELWQPDLIVRESFELGGVVAAEQRGLPHAVIGIGAYRTLHWLQHGTPAQLDEVRRAFGLPPDPDLAALARYLHFSFTPPSLQDRAAPLPPTAHILRHANFDQSGDEILPAWVGALPDRPVVYVTLGTAFNRRTDLLAAIIAGLRAEPFTLIVTIGRDGDRDAFGPQPEHVHIERYIPQSLLFPHCDLVVTHAGWSTVMGALGAGLPLVCVPVSADQPENAARAVASGAGLAIPAESLTSDGVRAAVRTVLTDPVYRESAERVRDEMAALPGLDRAVELLERLARERRPILN